MDSVRFGRALGIGARLAAKTVAEAVDAAAAPNPTPAPRPHTPPAAARRTPSPRPVMMRDRETAPQPIPLGDLPRQRTERQPASPAASRRSLRREGLRFGEALWAPWARLSGVLWLEVTGVFFGLFALSSAVGAWRLRGEWRHTAGNVTGHQHLVMTLVVALVFGYFCASSFLRAKRRARST